MNIHQAARLASLQAGTQMPVKKTLGADKIAQLAVKLSAASSEPVELSPKDWGRRWLSSTRFVLVTIKASSVALPTPIKDRQRIAQMSAAGLGREPIVVDVNKRSIGASSV